MTPNQNLAISILAQALSDLKSESEKGDAYYFLLNNEALEDLTFWCTIAKVPVHKVRAKARAAKEAA